MLVFFGSIIQVFSQTNPYFSYSNQKFIPSNVVYNSLQDQEGLMWFITEKGVMTYNGAKWNLLPDSLNLPYSDYTLLTLLKDGSVVIAGPQNEFEKEIAIYKNNKWTRITIPGKSYIYERYFLFEDDEEFHFYNTTSNYLQYYNSKTKTWSKSQIPTDFNYAQVKNLAYYNNQLILMTSNGVYTLNDKLIIEEYSFEFEKIKNELTLNILENKNQDTLVVLTTNRIFVKIEGQPEQSFPHKSIIRNDFFNYSNLILKNNRIYYSFSGPLFMLDLKTKITKEINGHGDRDPAVWTKVFFDYQDNLWLSSMRGISKINKLGISNYNTNGLLLENEVSTILHMPNDFHFIGHNSGFTILHGTDSVYWKHSFPKKPTYRILEAHAINQDELFAVATFGGLFRINIKNKTVFKQNWTTDYVRCINFRNDTTWAGELSSIKTYYKEKLIKEEKLRWLRRIKFDQNGDIKLLSKVGIYNYPIDTLINDDNLFIKKYDTYDIYEFNNQLLVATREGLFIYNNGKTTPFTIENTEDKLTVYAIVVDNDNHLWIGTSNGVYEIYNNKIINHLNVTNGLLGSEVNRAALTVDQHNNLWVGTNEGMSIINKDYLVNTPKAPKPYLKSIMARNKTIAIEETQKIDFDKNDIEINFGAYSYVDEELIDYRFKLLGLDKEWLYKSAPAVTSQRYNYLLPGDYQFVFQAREINGQWSEEVLSPKLIILKPYYFQFWFIALVILLTIGIFYATIQFLSIKKLQGILKIQLKQKMQEVNLFQDKLVKRNEELEKLNEEQDTLVYSISHDLRGPIMSTKGLINLYNFEKSASEKDHYVQLMDLSMTRLDGFINNILNISRNSRLAIKNEPVDLQSFITNIVDGHRFRDEAKDIQFSISCENQIINSDPDRLAMIMTNLISNAIVYSNPGETDKKICVSTKEVEETFQIIVHDNGVGIHKDYISDIFKIFVRANETKSGSGLGLYIANQTAEKLNAKLEVKSEYGKWTEFILILPK
ncbi:MAG: ATP-binding protein [Cyclobacteriaceae bacterium]|nr:ATP-binding protein [Cyclobacteriaceae bacterium]